MNKKISYAMMGFLLIPFMIPQKESMDLKADPGTPEVVSEVMLEEPTISTADPIKIDWELLLDIKFTLKYIPEEDFSMYQPIFTDAVKALDGKEVIIKGYVIPIDEEGTELALSANPYSSCFFCGEASPASIMSIFLPKKERRFKTDDFRTFRGKLVLNYDDPNQFYYLLKGARLE